MASEKTIVKDPQKLMLHACCGPCSLEPVRIFNEANIDFCIDYANSNIAPREEYEHRLETLKKYVVEPGNLELFTESHGNEKWNEKVACHGLDKEKRCRACYALRFEQAAKRAVEQGCDSLCTTLSISPYQFIGIIKEELEKCCEQHGLNCYFIDFSKYYSQATKRSRELGMYRQNYCGCLFSKKEAEKERQERKEARKKEKEEKRIAMMFAAAAGIVDQENLL